MKHICFCGCMVSGTFPCDTHIRFKMVDRPLYGSPYLIEGIPFRCVALDTREHAEFHVFISVGGQSLFAVLQGSLQSQTHCPFTICTFGQHHLMRSERPFSFVIPQYFMAREGALGQVG